MIKLQRSWIGSILVTVLSSAFIAASFNLFLIPHQLLSGGLSGIAMMIGYLTGFDISLLYLVLNLPVLIWGLVSIGRKFIVLSTFSVILTTWFMRIVPVDTVANDSIMSAVTGGVLLGIGSGITMRAGGSTGGLDIIGSILTRKRDFPLGTVLFALNGVVILMLGYYKNNWDLALYSMVTIFITGKVVDTIHIRHLKVTVYIVTQKKELLLQKNEKAAPRRYRYSNGRGIYEAAAAYADDRNDPL